MTVRVPVEPSVLSWALDVTDTDPEQLRDRFRVDDWLDRSANPTLKQLEAFAKAAGIAYGYLLLRQPPEWTLPVPDFREGFEAAARPSANLIAVLSQSQRRQDWYRDYVLDQGGEPLDFVGAAGDMPASAAAVVIRRALNFEVDQRSGTWADTRRSLLRGFEALGGLTVATSMVGNNTRRPLDEDEFRGFALVDDIAPLVFVNTHQTLNGQIFTLAHEVAHVWRGASGIGDESPRSEGQSEIERWCNQVASEVLVPGDVLEARYFEVDNALPETLDELAGVFRCGTLVVLQALSRRGLRRFDDFAAEYDAEVTRLRALQEPREVGGGDHYNNLPFRVGERLSRALIADALEGRTSIDEAMRLMSARSLSTFDEYARRLGAA